MTEPIFVIYEPSGKKYRIWGNGKIEGFQEGAVIMNGILPMMNYAYGLLKKAVDNGLITDEEAAHFLL
jgi:hypothetical protein